MFFVSERWAVLKNMFLWKKRTWAPRQLRRRAESVTIPPNGRSNERHRVLPSEAEKLQHTLAHRLAEEVVRLGVVVPVVL